MNRSEKIFLFFLPLLLSLPFLNRAFFVDDHYFVLIAKWLVTNPLNPYHFRADDAGLLNLGWELNGLVRMVNPLLHHYYLAEIIRWFGESILALRVGCVMLSCFSTIFIYEMARRWTSHPFLATCLTVTTPVFWLTSYSLLIDSTLCFFFFGSLYFYLRLMESEQVKFSLISGLFMGCAILSKYPGLLCIPLTGLWLLMRWRKSGNKFLYLVPWLIAIAFLVGYSILTKKLYGDFHILAASRRMIHSVGWVKIFILFVFLSGSIFTPILFWTMTRRRSFLLAVLTLSLVLFICAKPGGGFSKTQGFLLGLLLSTSLLLFTESIRTWNRWIYPRDYFIFSWVLGFLGMMFVVMNWVAVRYYFMVVPAIVFLVVRQAEIRWKILTASKLTIFLFIQFLCTGWIAYADYQQAEPSRQLVAQLKQKGFYGGENHYYLGDSFTMSYLREEGWIPCFQETEFQKGDWVLSKEVTMPLIWFFRKNIEYKEIANFDFPTKCPLKVMDYEGSAGFYASVWGALPYTLHRGPWEKFRLYEVTSVVGK